MTSTLHLQKQNLPDGMTMEEVKALYFSETALVEPKDTLYRIDGHGRRYYYKLHKKKPTFYISATDMIGSTLPKGYGFHEWLKNESRQDSQYKRDSRAAYGTLDHIECARYAIENKYDLDEIGSIVSSYAFMKGYGELIEEWRFELAKAVLSFAAFIEERNVEFIGIEIGLASDKMGVAGTIDYVVELDWNGGRKRAIIDKKTGEFWESSIVQLEIYDRIWKENFPNYEIDLLFNYGSTDWRSSPTFRLKNQTDEPARKKADGCLHNWRVDNEDNKPKDIVTYTGVLERGGNMSDNYKVESIEDFVKSKHED